MHNVVGNVSQSTRTWYDDYHNNKWHCACDVSIFRDCFLYVKIVQHELGLMLRLVRTDRGRQE